MKTLYLLFIFTILIITLLACTPSEESTEDISTDNESTNALPGFYIDGTTLYDSNNNPFVMRGINHGHSWYKEEVEVAIPAIAAAGANTIRVVLSDGNQWEKDDVENVKNVIALAEEHHLITVLEVHDALGTDNIDDLLFTVDYWIDIKEALIGKEDTVIINISNEWFGSWKGDAWAEGYKKAIPLLRDAGLEHTLIVDAAGWGQYPQSIHSFGKQVFESDSISNTMFSIHMYEYAGSDEETVKSNIDKVLEQGLAVVVGEFGHRHYDGNVDEDTILSHSVEKNVGWLAWSWHGNSEGVDYLDLAHDFSGSELSNWGDRIVNGANGLKEAAEISSVFE